MPLAKETIVSVIKDRNILLILDVFDKKSNANHSKTAHNADQSVSSIAIENSGNTNRNQYNAQIIHDLSISVIVHAEQQQQKPFKHDVAP
jgi:hypothetical protein